MMTIRANADNKFLLKYLLIGLGCFIFGCFAVKDILIEGPLRMEIATAWEGLKADKSLDDGEIYERYKEIAKDKQGWPKKRPEKERQSVEKAREFVIWNYGYAIIGLGVGIPCLLWWLRNRGTWIEIEGDTLRSSRKQQLTVDQITGFDKKKWEKKGIGVITYQTETGPQKFVIDDLKYSRKETDEIVRMIEAKITHEMIVNGAPEAVEEKT